MKKALAILVVLAAAVGVVVFAVCRIGCGGSDVAYLKDLAAEAPGDTVALFGVPGASDFLSELDGRVPTEVREELDDLPFDPFAAETYASLGIDIEAPAGLAVLGVDPPAFALVFGSGEPDESRQAFVDGLTGPLEVPADALEETEIGGHPGLIVEDEVAFAWAGERMFVAWTDTPYGSEATPGAVLAEYLAADEDSSLATMEGLDDALAFDGDPVATGVMNVGAVGEALAELDELGPIGADFDDFLAIGFALDVDDEHVGVRARGVMNEGSAYERLADGAPAPGGALDLVPGPVEAGIHARFDFAVALEMMEERLQADPTLWAMYNGALAQGQSETGVDVKNEVFAGLTGELGLFLSGVPSGPEDITSLAGVLFIGVTDEEQAVGLLDRLNAAIGGLAVRTEIDDSVVFAVALPPGQPAVSFGVHAGYVWITVGPTGLAGIVGGDVVPFADDERSAAAAEVFDGDYLGAGFVDFSGALPRAMRWISSGRLVQEEAADEQAEALLAAIHNVQYRSGLDGDIAVADLRMDWDGEAVATALGDAAAAGASAMGPGTATPPVFDPPPGSDPLAGTGTRVAPTDGGGDPRADEIQRIARGAATYYATDHASRTGKVIEHQFPGSVAPTPGFAAFRAACAKGEVAAAPPLEWQQSTWLALNFQGSGSPGYIYAFSSRGIETASTFTASAWGDLDCDGVFSTFERYGFVENGMATSRPEHQLVNRED